MSSKQVILRAFNINQVSDISTVNKSIITQIRTKTDTASKERRMTLNEMESEPEVECAAILKVEEEYAFGIIMKFRIGNDTTHIPESIFDKKNFTFDDMQTLENGQYAEYIDHYFFCLNQKHMITNLRGNQTIKRFSVYINWLIKTEDYEFTPVIDTSSEVRLSEINSITIGNNRSLAMTVNKNAGQSPVTSSVVNMGVELIRNIFINDTTTLSEQQIENIVSAKLILKLKKPNKMTDEDYQSKYGAILNPIADSENIVFNKKKGGSISGKTLLKVKKVDVTTTQRKHLVENDIYREMRTFLKELATDEAPN